MQTKSFCEDLTEGKFSFPIIHAVHSKPHDSRLLNILRQRTEDLDVKRHAVQWLAQCGSLLYTREALRGLHLRVVDEIHRLGGHTLLVALIDHLDGQLDAAPGQKQDDVGNGNDIASVPGGEPALSSAAVRVGNELPLQPLKNHLIRSSSSNSFPVSGSVSGLAIALGSGDRSPVIQDKISTL